MQNIRGMWRKTVVKDGVVMLVVIALVFIVEIGTYNSCYCRASFSHPAVVDIMPYSPAQWATARSLWVGLPSAGLVVNFVLIAWFEVGGGGGRGGSPLNKSEEEKGEELGELRRLERMERERGEKLPGLEASTTLVLSEDE